MHQTAQKKRNDPQKVLLLLAVSSDLAQRQRSSLERFRGDLDVLLFISVCPLQLLPYVFVRP